MDLEEWEILPRSVFLDFHEDDEKKNYGATKHSSNFNMNYFVCPSSPSENSRAASNQLDPIPFQFEPKTITTGKDQEQTKVSDLASKKEADQDPISQVFFKKMKENEFVDMKILESPTSKGSFLPPQIDATGKFCFDEKSETFKGEILETKITFPRLKNKNENIKVEEKEEEQVHWEVNNGGLNLWKWSLNGIGAICSFGVAAATVFIIIFRIQQRDKQEKQNQKLRFPIYSDDKRIKQVATTVRGVPIAIAHISFGDYYDGLSSNCLLQESPFVLTVNCGSESSVLHLWRFYKRNLLYVLYINVSDVCFEYRF